jgi:hypothetical protein
MVDVCFNTSGVMSTDFMYFYFFLILYKSLIVNDPSTLHILHTQFYDACESMES